MKKLLYILSLIVLLPGIHKAQQFKLYPARVVDGDTLPVIVYNTVTIEDKMSAKMRKWYKHNTKLVRNVKKVMPYAKLAAAKLKVIDSEMAALSTERERKIYYKSKEKELRDQFEKDLVKLNFSQGALLMKLIDRETGKTTYKILKDYRNTVNAVFWQGFARIFGYNLKKGYDPVADHEIELVIKMLGYD